MHDAGNQLVFSCNSFSLIFAVANAVGTKPCNFLGRRGSACLVCQNCFPNCSAAEICGPLFSPPSQSLEAFLKA